MPSSDLPLTRRQALAAGAGGVALLFAGPLRGGAGGDVAEAASATCVMTPEKTEGPYFVDEALNRSDIRASKDGSGLQPGTPLALTMYVFDATADCAPVTGAQVDVWHANAAGEYSDVAQNGTTGQTWLRGYQVTDGDGKVTFRTIWPGWYRGRAVHIHFKVRASGLEFTSQLFFTDAMNAQVFASAPYSGRGTADTLDTGDGIYGTDGSSLLLRPTSDGAGGYRADFSVGIAGGGAGSGDGDDADTAIAATLLSLRARRTGAGRDVRVRLRAGEPLTVRARLSRDGRTLARRSRTLRAGKRTLRLPIETGTRAGGAQLTLVLSDAAGNRRVVRRTVHVPRRR